MRKWKVLLMISVMAAALAGCSSEKNTEKMTEIQTETVTEAQSEEETVTEPEAVTEVQSEEETAAETEVVTEVQSEEKTVAETEVATEVQSEEKTVAESEYESEKEAGALATDGIFGVFETQTLDGETVTQEIFTESEVTMVNVWGTFCGPCINEMPGLGELSREYEDTGLRIIGMLIDVTDPEDETAHLIVDETKADYTHLVLSESLYYSSLWEIQAVPTTVFVDREGKKIGQVYTSARSKEAWSEIIESVLESVQQ